MVLHGVVAMDGPSGTGKSTVSRRLARELQADYLDTGAMYRAVTLACLRAGLTAESPAEEITKVALSADLASVTDPAAPRILLEGEDVEAEIRGEAVTKAVSAVSAVPEVRAALVARQQAYIAAASGIVVEGRDIGSVVAPDAGLKIYLTASEEVRAARRNRQDLRAGRVADPESSLSATLADVQRRDRLDSTRKTSPLHAAPDALVLDTDELSVEQVHTALLALVEERGLVS